MRARVLAAGVSLPDLMMREGIHPETPALPFTPGWDPVGVADRLGDGVSGIEPGQTVAAPPPQSSANGKPYLRAEHQTLRNSSAPGIARHGCRGGIPGKEDSGCESGECCRSRLPR